MDVCGLILFTYHINKIDVRITDKLGAKQAGRMVIDFQWGGILLNPA